MEEEAEEWVEEEDDEKEEKEEAEEGVEEEEEETPLGLSFIFLLMIGLMMVWSNRNHKTDLQDEET